MRKKVRERGSIALAGMAMMLAFCGALGLFVEHAVASALSQRLQIQVDAACECASGPSFSLVAKCSEAPGADTATALASALRASGYTGRITVWYWESEPLGEAQSTVAVWGVQVAQDFTTPMSALAGTSHMPVGAYAVDWRMLWSNQGASWRPESAGCGSYVFDEGVSYTYTRKDDIGDMPYALRECAERATSVATGIES